MKIAIVGCGALGSYYGARLCRAGHEVHFLLRSDFETVRRQGVRIQSVEGDFHVRPHCACSPEEIGTVETVFIGLKTTANDQLGRLLPPLVGPATALVSLQNGLGNAEALAALFGPDNVLCGLCFVCLHRVAPGIIDHSAHGRVVLGEYQRPATARTRSLAGQFQAAGVPCEVTDDLARALWAKLIWNIPFNGLGVAGMADYEACVRGELLPDTVLGPCLPTDQLLGDPRWEQLVRELMGEVIATARALGLALEDRHIETNLERTRIMGAYKASTLLDFERGLPLELESLFRAPLHCAQRAGVPTPRLARLCQVLQQLEQRRRANQDKIFTWV